MVIPSFTYEIKGMQKKEETISGPDAIERMRRLKLIHGSVFGLKFITYDYNRPEKSGNVNIYLSCRLRTARRSEGLRVDSDHYLYFTDTELDAPKQCFKKLIRAVCFPPNNKWYKVNWFDNE